MLSKGLTLKSLLQHHTSKAFSSSSSRTNHPKIYIKLHKSQNCKSNTEKKEHRSRYNHSRFQTKLWLVTDVQRDRLPKMNLRSFIILALKGKSVLLTLSSKLECLEEVSFSFTSFPRDIEAGCPGYRGNLRSMEALLQNPDLGGFYLLFT